MTFQYEIEKGVEMPPDKRKTSKYPFEKMEVGDSFFVPEKTAISLQSTCSLYKQKTGYKFILREVDGGVRIWRSE
jgi:hypothetical protein